MWLSPSMAAPLLLVTHNMVAAYPITITRGNLGVRRGYPRFPNCFSRNAILSELSISRRNKPRHLCSNLSKRLRHTGGCELIYHLLLWQQPRQQLWQRENQEVALANGVICLPIQKAVSRVREFGMNCFIPPARRMTIQSKIRGAHQLLAFRQVSDKNGWVVYQKDPPRT
jgi:hypothetical protein